MKIVVLYPYRNWDSSVAEKLAGENFESLYLFRNRSVRFASKKRIMVFMALAFFKSILWIPKMRNAQVYCVGFHLSQMLLYKFFGWLMGNGQLYVHNFYIHGMGRKRTVKRILRFLADCPRTHLLVQSESEVEYFHELSLKINVTFVPYCNDFDADKVETIPVDNFMVRDYIFTGGFTNRDYGVVVEVAQKHHEWHFVIVVSDRNKLPNVSENVTVFHDLPSQQFNYLLKNASVVVVPLKEDVGASGQMLTIAAMRYSRPIVFCNISVINCYFTKESGVPYNIGDAKSLEQGVTSIMRMTKEERQHMGRKAFMESLKYSTEESACLIRKLMGI